MNGRPLLVLLSALLLVAGSQATADGFEAQRELYAQAEKALRHNDTARFTALSRQLRDYPLHPYLEYRALRARLAQASPNEVAAFLQQHADTPLAGLLRGRWLDHLAQRRRWTTYLDFYQPTTNVSRRCHRLNALIETGQRDKAMPEVAPLWLHGESQPKACDPVFAAWTDAGLRTDDLIWQRVELAMAEGEWRLARYLGGLLPAAERTWVERWIGLHTKPARAAEFERFATAHPYREKMLAHAVRRLARWDGSEALALWQDLRPRFPFTDDERNRTERYLLRNLVRVAEEPAYAFIGQVDVGTDVLAHEARIRAALLHEDWPRVLCWITALPADESDSERWRYWRARALAGTGRAFEADALFDALALERSFYGFLAADHIGEDYYLLHADTPVDPRVLTELRSTPAMQRARELFLLGRYTEANREWRWATRGLDNEALRAAAKLAETKGWHDRAIFTLARTGYWDDLELRFPLEHATLVDLNAQRHGIDNAWVFAVMRQESAFMANARSHAGAMGLMQLMPATARNVARTVLKRKPPRRSELFKPDTNIALGSAYLGQMKDKLGNSAVLATAAYNAGPHRVARWLPERILPADIWIELVPFRETRGYLQRVLAYTVIYEKRMGRAPTRLRDRLHPVPPNVNMIGNIIARSEAASAG